MIKSDDRSVTAICFFRRVSQRSLLAQLGRRLNCTKHSSMMFDSYIAAFFIFMHGEQHHTSCPVTIPHTLSPPDSRHREH